MIESRYNIKEKERKDAYYKFGNTAMYNPKQTGIFKAYTAQIKADPPDWKQLSKDAKITGEFGYPMDEETTKSWHFYNWVIKNYPEFDLESMYILKEPPSCPG